MIKSAIYMAGFYAVYSLFLGSDTLYKRNRAFILFSLLSSFILPLITINMSTRINLQIFGRVLSDIFISGNADGKAISASQTAGPDNFRNLFIIYISGTALFGIKLIVDLLELFVLISRNKIRGSHIIRFNGLDTAGFSAFGHVFINSRLSDDEAGEIIRHEQNHLRHNHSFDIILIEIIRVIQWFNPVIHLFSRSLRAVHEYQADDECLSLGTSVRNYQQLLMNQVFRSKVFTISNSFSNPSLIKKRMIMMTRKRSNALANLKLIMVLPVIAGLLLFISSCNQDNNKTTNTNLPEVAPPPPPPPPYTVNESDTTYSNVDVMPQFSGGDAGLLQFIAANTKYPEVAKKNGTQGKVIVRFCVTKNGSIDKVAILKSVDPELDKESIRVVNLLKFEKPALKDGKPVAVWYMVPINFVLK